MRILELNQPLLRPIITVVFLSLVSSQSAQATMNYDAPLRHGINKCPPPTHSIKFSNSRKIRYDLLFKILKKDNDKAIIFHSQRNLKDL